MKFHELSLAGSLSVILSSDGTNVAKIGLLLSGSPPKCHCCVLSKTGQHGRVSFKKDHKQKSGARESNDPPRYRLALKSLKVGCLGDLL